MECPVCFCGRKQRRLKGCTHSICNACYTQMASLDESVHYELQGVFVADIPQIRIKCPLCRSVEPSLSVDELKHLYPDEYLTWMEYELHRDDAGRTFAYGFTSSNYTPQKVTPQKYNTPRKVKRYVGRKM